MKKRFFQPVISGLLIFLSISLFSFSGTHGGDELRIYVNGKQVLQQFMYSDKSIKNLQLTAANENGKVDVYYFHCGRCGTGRMLTIRNERNQVLKELKFPDADNSRAAMSFAMKDILPKNKPAQLNLYYSSKELPEGRKLATIGLESNQHVAMQSAHRDKTISATL